jgi:RNA polymerase sigma factor (sigma-70 family)
MVFSTLPCCYYLPDFLFVNPTLLFIPASMLYRNDPILDNLKELIKECIAGNRSMQNKLYKYYASRMMGVCLRYSKSRADAQEILQEGFIKVFTCLHQYNFRGSLEGWIKRTMINCALQKLRTKSSLYPVINVDEVSERYIDVDAMASLHAKELLILIQNLPTMCKLVFNLYVFEGCTHREIAEMLHISEGTSKSNLHDARMILQKQLHQEMQMFKTKM